MANRDVTITYRYPEPALISDWTRVTIEDSAFRAKLKDTIDAHDDLIFVQTLFVNTILIDTPFEEFPKKFLAFVEKYKLEEILGVTIQLVPGDSQNE